MKTIILDATTKSLQAVMSGAAATTNPDFTCSWADNNGTTFTEGSTDGAFNGTTPVTLAAAPGASTRRTIKSLTIQNRDTAAVTITLQYNNNTTLRQMAKFTLAVDDVFTLESTYDANGQMKTVSTTGTVNLATSVTGTLPVANGGTGVTSSTGTVAVVLSTSPTLVTPLLGTPTSGTLTNCTGLPIAGLVASTSTAIGVGSVELGHASDTTIARSAAGVVTIEGQTVHTSGRANSFGAFTAYFTETDNGNSSTADTIDWGLSNKQKSTLTGNCTFTFTAPAGPASLILKLVQDGTGSRTVTWPAAVHWSGGTAPTLTATASKVDIITFYYDGTTYFGNSTLNFTA